MRESCDLPFRNRSRPACRSIWPAGSGGLHRQYVKLVNDHAIEGWMKCPPEGGGWGNGLGKANYTIYFHAEFSKPIARFGVWSAEIPAGWSRKREDIESERYQNVAASAKVLEGCREMEGDHLGFYSEFASAKANRFCSRRAYRS